MTNSIIKAEKHFRFSKAFFALFAIIIFFQTNASCQFTAVSGLSNYPIMNIDILSPTQVWMVSYDKAFKSTNGAASFSTVLLTDTTNTASPQSIEMIYPGIHGLNMNKAFLFNNFDIPGDGIMKTNLGNGNWGSVYSSSSNPEYNNRIVDLDIASDGVGIAAGGNGIILRTTDFGNNWNVVSTGPTAQPNNYVHYFGNETWIITSIHHVLKSYDHGLTWTTIELEYINDNLWSILDFSAVGDVCYITTNQLSFGKSLNQGETWEFIEVPFFTASISAGSADVVYCSDYVFEKLYKSIDGGNTWEYVPITGISSINDIEFYNESFGGLGVTGVGAMFTTNGGGPTLPYCSFTLDPYSCSGENLPIVNQCFNVPGNTYEWYINGTLVSTEFDLEYQVASPSYIDIELVVTNSNGSNSFSMETNVVAPPTIPIVNVTFPQDTICANSSLVFTVQSSQSGTNYRFFKDGIFISGQNGTGSNMTFNTGALTQDTFVEIKGIRSTTCRTDTTVFSQQITVVSMDPTIEVFLPADSICRNITPLFIGVTNTNPLWSYRYNSTGSTFYPGNGDTLLIPFTTSNTSPFIPAIVAKFNQTGCTINKNATTQLVPILASSALTVSPNIVETDEIVNLNLSSNYLQHFWEFAPYASVNEYYGLINEITYSTTGRDTIVLNEIFADSSCFTTHKKQVNIVENIVPEEPTFCSSNSNVITKQTLRAIVDEYGNHIICGFYLSSGNSPSLFVRKENVFGELVFEKTATVNNASTYGISVATDEEQNIYLIGQSVAGNTIWNNYLTNSTFFAKLNQQGDVEWFLSSPEYNYLDLGITNNQIYILCKSSSSTSDISIDQSNGETFELPIPFGLTSNIDFFVEMSLDGIINNVTTTGIGSGIQNPNSHNTIGFLRSSPIAYPKMKIKDNKLFILAEMSTYNESFTYAIGNSIIENTIVGIEGQNSNGNLAYFKWDLGTNDMSCKLIMNASLIVPHDIEILDNSVLAISDFNYTGFYDAEGPHFEFMELMNTKRSCILNLDFEGNVNWKRIEFFSNYYHLERASATSAYAIISADAEASILSNNTNFGYTTNGLSGCILATLHEDGSVTDFINLDEPERDAVQSMQLDACGNLLITKGNNLYSYQYPINNYSATSTWTVSKIGFGPCNENCSANFPKSNQFLTFFKRLKYLF